MPSWNHNRAVDSMRIMAEMAAEYGVPESRVLAGTGVSVKRLRDPEVIVEATQELQLISNLVEHLGEVPALGVIAGQRYHFTTFGALGFALVSSKNLFEAMRIGLKYIQLTFAFCRFSLLNQEDFTHISINSAGLPDHLQQFILERDVACLITLQREIFSQLTPLVSLSLSFPAPGDTSPYESAFGIMPGFDKPMNAVVLDNHQLAQPMPQASELARRLAEQQCEILLNQRLKRSGLAAKVRQILAARASDMPGMEEVAHALNTIPRTLRRHLEQENTSFAALRDEVRQALAEEYLLGPRLSVEQVAERLGYSSTTSFINAYKRWYGITPSVRRAQLTSANYR